MRLEALDGLDTDDALMLRFVGEQRRTGNVADGINAANIGAAITVDLDGAAVDFDAKPFKAKIFYITGDADCRNDAFDGMCLGTAFAIIYGRCNAIGLLVEAGHLGACENLDALLLERLAGEAVDLGILNGEDLRQ